jgi:hypothetical protein
MDFKNNLETKLKEKGLTESSIKLYLRNLQKLNDDLPLKNFKFLENFDAIIEKLKVYKPNTQRGYLISIVSPLSIHKDDNKKTTKLFKKYYDKMMEINTEIRAVPTDEKTKTQSENWMKWSEIEGVFKELKFEVDKFVNNKVISENQYNKLLSLMVLSLYVLIPARRNKDYMMMDIVRPYNALNEDRNYLDYDGKKFIFNVYKTAKKHNQKEEAIPDTLMEIINLYLKHHPAFENKKLPKKINTPFLVFKDGSAFSADNTITRILNKIFGKKISSSMIYHIYVSDKFGDNLKEMKEVADSRGHNVEMLQEYIKK